MNDLPIISIHAPRTGSDVRRKDGVTYDVLISIHAPRTGSDRAILPLQGQGKNFNPRSPHGERRNGCRSADNS